MTQLWVLWIRTPGAIAQAHQQQAATGVQANKQNSMIGARASDKMQQDILSSVVHVAAASPGENMPRCCRAWLGVRVVYVMGCLRCAVVLPAGATHAG